MVPPASCESPPLPSGRAVRAKVRDAFRLPHGYRCDRYGVGCHPRKADVRQCPLPAGSECFPYRLTFAHNMVY